MVFVLKLKLNFEVKVKMKMNIKENQRYKTAFKLWDDGMFLLGRLHWNLTWLVIAVLV